MAPPTPQFQFDAPSDPNNQSDGGVPDNVNVVPGFCAGDGAQDPVGMDPSDITCFYGDTLTLDDLSEDLTQPSGSGTLCADGGGNNGEVEPTDMAQYILGCQSSLAENLNERGYAEYATGDPPSSPPTTDLCTPSAEATNWVFQVVYEVWIDAKAFGANGYGESYITEVHASPSKDKDATIVVEPSEFCGVDGYCKVPWPPVE